MSLIQSIIFNKKIWTEKDAEIWLKDRSLFPIKKVHITKKSLRYRIIKPNFNRYATKKLNNGITLVFGFI